MKVLYFDVETTGLCSKQNAIIQLACILKEDEVEVGRLNIQINPHTYNKKVEINDKALAVSGTTREDLEDFEDSGFTFRRFIQSLDKWVDKYDKNDKIIPIGYNSSSFDVPFLKEWFLDNKNKYYGAYFDYKDIDVFAYVKILTHLGKIKTENQKLETLCRHFNIKINAHDALSDIEATMDLFKKLQEL